MMQIVLYSAPTGWNVGILFAWFNVAMKDGTIAGLVLFLGACAIRNTPQQELAYARWTKCNARYIQLERIDLDGRITFRISNEGSRQATMQCLAEAGRTGPALPEPVGVWPPSGP